MLAREERAARDSAPTAQGREIAALYNPATGYYGEAWGKLAIDASGNTVPGQYTEVIQANRGTVFSSTGADAPQNVAASTTSGGIVVPAQYVNANPGEPADTNSRSDFYSTVGTDVRILFGLSSAYLTSANTFYTTLRATAATNTIPYATIPIIETGQSLGGGTAIAVGATQAGPNVSLATDSFNALPVGRRLLGLTTAQAATLKTPTTPGDPTTAPVANYYVGNEIVTQNILNTSLELVTGGEAVGASVILPALPNINGAWFFARATQIHDAASAVSQLYSALYLDPTSALYTSPSSATRAAAQAWLAAVYPDPGKTPAQITAVLNGQPETDDPPSAFLLPNPDGTITYIQTGDGTLQDADTIETLRQSSALAGTASVTKKIVPALGAQAGAMAANQPVAEFQTTVTDGAGNTVGLIQNDVYADGGLDSITFDPSTMTATEILRYAADGSYTEVPCFCAGTSIMTGNGPVDIETLSIGDLVITASGELRPIRWIGRRSYDRRFVAGNPDVIPIRFARDAIADGVPHT
jgi:hypothetical protein